MIQCVGGQQSICALLESLSNHANVTHQGQKDMIHYILKAWVRWCFWLTYIIAVVIYFFPNLLTHILHFFANRWVHDLGKFDCQLLSSSHGSFWQWLVYLR